jgi:hypothetical protein
MKPKKKRLYARHKKLAELRAKEEQKQQKILEENKKIESNIIEEQYNDVSVSDIKIEKESEVIVTTDPENPKEESPIVKVKKNIKTSIIIRETKKTSITNPKTKVTAKAKPKAKSKAKPKAKSKAKRKTKAPVKG